MNKKNRQLYAKGFILNLKLVSNSRKGEETLADLLSKVKKQKIISKVSSDREVLIRTFFKSDHKEKDFYYGKFTSGIKLGDEPWINLDSLEDSEVEIPKNHIAKIRETEFLFIPKAHRILLLEKKGCISYKQIRVFLNDAISKVIKTGEEIEVFIEKDSELIKSIFESRKVEWLEFKISRSNSDNTDEVSEWFQEELDDANVYTFQGKFLPKPNEGGVNIKNKLVAGTMELSNSNGYLKARVKNSDGKSEIIETKKHDQKYIIPYSEPEYRLIDLFNFVMRKFRNNG